MNETSPVTDNSLAGALAELQKDLPEIKKTEIAEVEMKSGGKFRYAYADLAGISAAILPRMAALGLSFTSNPTMDGGEFVLAYRLWHAGSGEKIEGRYPLPKTGTPQTQGSAITYARRYTLVALTGLAPENDDDAALAESQPKTAQRASTPRSRPGASVPTGEGHNVAQRATGTGDGPSPDVPILPGQRTEIVAMFDQLSIMSRSERLDISAGIAKRPDLGSVNDLTRNQANRLVRELKMAATTKNPAEYLRQYLPDDTQPATPPEGLAT